MSLPQWKDRKIERENTYKVLNNKDGTITLMPVTGEIYDPGTPLNALNLNKINSSLEHIKKKNYINVLDYGADNLGQNNSTQAFVNAINNLNNGVLFIPKGTYLLDEITINKSIKILGEGKNNTILKRNTNASLYSSLLKISGSTNEDIIISDLTIDCQNTKSFGILASLLKSFDMQNSIIKNVGTNGFKEGNKNSIDGIMFIKVYKAYVNNVEFDVIERDGLLGFPCSYLTVSNCRFTNCGRFPSANQQNEDIGGNSESPVETYYHNNYAYNCGSGGFDVETSSSLPSTYASYVGNKIINCGSNDWGYNWGIIVGVNSYGEVIDNYIENMGINSSLTNYGCGISCGENKGDVIISNNRIINCKNHGIFVNHSTQNVIVSNNIVNSNNKNGIYVLNNANTIVESNIIKNNKYHGILVNLSSGSIIKGNVISSNSKDTTNTYSGIKSELNYNISIIDNRIDGTSHKYGFELDNHNYKSGVIFKDNNIDSMGTRWFNFAGSFTSKGNISNGVCEFLGTSIWGTTDGTWNVGDKIIITDYVTNSYVGWICTTSGTPGTWKKYGAIVS